MNSTLDANNSLFEKNYLSTSDVLLFPTTGTLKSRSEAYLNSTFIYSSPMDTVASFDLFHKMKETNQAFLSCRFNSNDYKTKELQCFHTYDNYWFTVGASVDDYNFLAKLFYEDKLFLKVNVAVDVAHGDTTLLHEIYEMYSSAEWCNNLMSGTIATPGSAINLVNAGCTHIRVGIGPGSACSTRIVTGCGVPNLSAVYSIVQELKFSNKSCYVIADGGIKSTGDIVKYLAAGASGVMIGSLLSNTTESPMWKTNWFRFLLNKLSFNYLYKNKVKYKKYRGQASEAFQLDTKGFISFAAEGVEAKPSYTKYDYLTFYQKTLGGIASAISYLGLKSIRSLNPKNVLFIQISQNGLQESKPHILE